MSDNRLIKPNQLGNRSLWKKVGFYHQGQQDPNEIILIRRDRSVTVFKSQQQQNSEIKSMDRKSQTEEQKDQYINQESVFAEQTKPVLEDAAFQDVLGVLRMTEANEQQLIQRVNTLMNEQQLTLDVSPLEKELFGRNKKDLCREALSQVADLRMMIEVMREYLIQLQSSWENVIKNTLSLKVSMVEEAIVYDMQSPLKFSQTSDINIIKNYEDQIDRLCAELNGKKEQLRHIELKYSEECTTQRAALERAELDRKLLNMELNEVIARFEEQRKMLRLRNDVVARECSCQTNQKMRTTIEAKDNQIFELKKELEQQYASIENLASIIRQLESKSSTVDSTFFIEQKNNELAQLDLDNRHLKEELESLRLKFSALENESYSLYEQNFSLQQAVESFPQQIQEKLNEQKKAHYKQLKQVREIIEALQSEKNRLEDEVEEYKNIVARLNRQIENASSSMQSTPSIRASQNLFRQDIIANNNSLNKEQIPPSIYLSPDRLKEEWQEQTGARSHVRSKIQKAVSGMEQSSLYLDDRKQFDVLSRGSFLERKPVKEGRISPLSLFYPTPDRSKMLGKQIYLNKVLHVKDDCGSGRMGSIGSQNYRAGSNDKKSNQFINIEMKLNNLTKEIQTEMAQVPLRRYK